MITSRIYLDLDGVMADFDRHFVDYFGVDNKSMSDAEMWKMINGYDGFFRNLPPCEGAIEFFEIIREFGPFILTACPKSNYERAAVQKREWVKEHLSPWITVLPVLGGKNKKLFMHDKGDILIDDFEKNCNAWNEHGGTAILHKNFEETKKMLFANL